MKYCKKLWLKYYIRKDERTLLEAGVQETARLGKNLQVGLEYKAIINETPLERIYFPQNEEGKINISPLLALGAEKNPKVARRYIVYQEMLNRLESH